MFVKKYCDITKYCENMLLGSLKNCIPQLRLAMSQKSNKKISRECKKR